MKLDMVGDLADRVQSPSTRREWIEIILPTPSALDLVKSPSTRREWIEMQRCTNALNSGASPSTRREWIEICHI